MMNKKTDYTQPEFFLCEIPIKKEQIINDRLRIGNRIRELREAAGLSQQELAEKTGLRQQNIARVELGKYSTGQDILSTIAAALGKRLDIV